MNFYQNQKAQPANIRTNGSNTISIQANVPNKPAVSGITTSRGKDTISLLKNWVFGTAGQINQNQGNTYNNTPVEQKNQKYVTAGYSGKVQALGGSDQSLDTKNLRPNAIYNPFKIGQKAGVTSSPTKNIGQLNFNSQWNTNANPLMNTANPFVITQAQTGITGGFNGNITTIGNPNVVPSASKIPNVSVYASNTQPLTGTTNTINQTQNKFSTDLPIQRQAFSAASEKVGWHVAEHIRAAIPSTDPRWNMRQKLYQKALQSEDPLIEIQNNPQLKPSQQYMQQQGSNITQLENYNAFTGNYTENLMQGIKENPMLPFGLIAVGIGAFFLLKGKK